MYSAIALTSFGTMTGMDNYTAVGRHFADVIMQQGVNGSHVTAHFGDPASSWISTYPMGFDKMLGLDTFNATSYKLQSDWYATVTSTYGMPFFSDVQYAVGDLIPWCAVTSSDAVRDALIGGIHAFLTDGKNNEPGPTRWYVTGSNPAPGTWPGTSSINKPTAGAYWMLVAANMYQCNGPKGCTSPPPPGNGPPGNGPPGNGPPGSGPPGSGPPGSGPPGSVPPGNGPPGNGPPGNGPPGNGPPGNGPPGSGPPPAAKRSNPPRGLA